MHYSREWDNGRQSRQMNWLSVSRWMGKPRVIVNWGGSRWSGFTYILRWSGTFPSSVWEKTTTRQRRVRHECPMRVPLADIRDRIRDVRFASESRHSPTGFSCPLSATSRHVHSRLTKLFRFHPLLLLRSSLGRLCISHVFKLFFAGLFERGFALS
jgi:hypothetical protein